MFAMLRFLAGTLLVQAASVALVIVAGAEARDWETWLPIAVALGVIGLIAAFWFTTVATNLRRDKLDRQRADFARERENLRVKAEREKTRLVRKGQKDIASETRRAESRANRKVALAMAAAGAVGVLMMMSSFITLGLLLLTGTGSALGGYLAGRRWPPKRLVDSDSEVPEAPRRWLRGRSAIRSLDQKDQ